MTPDEIEKDRAEGTPGPWMALGTPVIGFTEVKAQPLAVRGFTRRICCVDAVNNTDRERDANARRIARVPELEKAYLDLTAEVQRLTADHDARIRAAIEPDAPSVSAAAKVLLDALDMPPYPIGQQALAQTRRVITALATKENSDE